MSLESTLLSASSGLASIQQRLAVVSQNVANAGTPGYAKEVTDTSARAAGGQGMGVASGPARGRRCP
jgi:flagellar hook-associated protein 1 FlgK